MGLKGDWGIVEERPLIFPFHSKSMTDVIRMLPGQLEAWIRQCERKAI